MTDTPMDERTLRGRVAVGTLALLLLITTVLMAPPKVQPYCAVIMAALGLSVAFKAMARGHSGHMSHLNTVVLMLIGLALAIFGILVFTAGPI